MAGFNPSSNQNRAVYWGQNSFGQAGSQQRLSYYCKEPNVDIIPIAFLSALSNPLTLNVANARDNCTTFADNPQLLDCPQIEDDIQTCQKTYGKTITLSLGGATYTQGGFTSSTDAVNTARDIWERFGPVQAGSTKDRPFGNAVIDGFDFDLEATVANMVPFGNELRRLMNVATSAGGKKYYLSAAPQCPYPDSADHELLAASGVSFDFIMLQYYNNYCGVNNFVPGATTQNNFNFDTWDNWAKTVSVNKAVKLLLGIPANTGAGAGYTNGSKLKAAIQYSKSYSSYGGVMFWDASQLWANTGFLAEVKADMA